MLTKRVRLGHIKVDDRDLPGPAPEVVGVRTKIPEERRAEVLAKVKELGTRKRGLVGDDELRDLVDD